jgi:hypothetical protein
VSSNNPFDFADDPPERTPFGPPPLPACRPKRPNRGSNKTLIYVLAGVLGGVFLLCCGGIGLVASLGGKKAATTDQTKSTDEAVRGGPSPPAPEEKKADGDPSVNFANLDFRAIDLSVGPWGQSVKVNDEVRALRQVTRQYQGKGGNWYMHGEQRVVRPGGVVERIENFVYGRRHGYFYWNMSEHEPGVAVEEWCHNGERTKWINWLDKGRGLKDTEEYYRNGKRHGWCSAWGPDGTLLWRNRYVDGEIVERSKNPFDK